MTPEAGTPLGSAPTVKVGVVGAAVVNGLAALFVDMATTKEVGDEIDFESESLKDEMGLRSGFKALTSMLSVMIASCHT